VISSSSRSSSRLGREGAGEGLVVVVVLLFLVFSICIWRMCGRLRRGLLLLLVLFGGVPALPSLPWT